MADLNPARGSKPGKIRPVVIIQNNLLNDQLDTTIICPITSKTVENINYLRIGLFHDQLDKKSDILMEQVRAIEKRKLIKKLSSLNHLQIKKMKRNLAIILDL